MALYDAGGRVLASLDDYDFSEQRIRNKIMWQALTGGDYYIVIGDENTLGNFALTVTEGEATEPIATPTAAPSATSTPRPTPPAGSFNSVSAGGNHTCGVRSDGSVACWGSDEYGQATPLAGSFSPTPRAVSSPSVGLHRHEHDGCPTTIVETNHSFEDSRAVGQEPIKALSVEGAGTRTPYLNTRTSRPHPTLTPTSRLRDQARRASEHLDSPAVRERRGRSGRGPRPMRGIRESPSDWRIGSRMWTGR